MQSAIVQRAKLLIVDDDESNTSLLSNILRVEGYQSIRVLNDSRSFLSIFIEYRPDLILLDLNMPYINGFQILQLLTAFVDDTEFLPIIIVTAEESIEAKRLTLSTGAIDFISKPFVTDEVVLRVNNVMRQRFLQLNLQEQNNRLQERIVERTRALEYFHLELKEAHTEVLVRLAKAAEYRDDDTGEHTQRVGIICSLLAQEMGLSAEQVAAIRRAAPIHDVGKIGISDNILLKPGRLSDEERAIMQRHAQIGADLLRGGHSDLVQTAELIAFTHHERWDGSGYPRRLQREEIPHEGRILAVADVFDALTHARPYKAAWPLQDALNEIKRQRGKQFDPDVVDAFMLLPHQDLL